MDAFSLSGRVAVVTGGNGGIGLGIARGLASAGAAVSVWGRDPDKNRAAVAELAGLGGDVDAVAVDVTDEASVVAATATTLERFGRIDILVANAGISSTGDFPSDFPMDEFDRVMEVNARGAFLTIREVTNAMVVAANGGSVVVVASTAGLLGLGQSPHYSASKGAALAMTRALAVRLARHGIRVNAIAPGFVRTDMTDPMAANPRFEEVMIGMRTPLRRWGAADDLAGSAVYLASDASSYVTGATLVVDGGFSIS